MTRNFDDVLQGSEGGADLSWLSDAGGTFYHDIQLGENTSHIHFTITQGTGINDTYQFLGSSYQQRSDGSLVVNADAHDVNTANTRFRSVVGIAVDDVAGYVNGSSTFTDTSAALPIYADLSTMRLASQTGTNLINGLIKEIRYYDSRLTDAQLEDMSNGTFP